MNVKKEIIRIAHKLYQCGYLTAFDGNISYRIAPNRFWITPSKVSKEKLNELDLILIDEYGTVIEGTRGASTELPMHLEAYRQRPDINAVIHAHPRNVTACTLAQIPLNRCILPEMIIALGSVPTATYATPCTGEGAQVICDLVRKFNAIALDRHGSLTVGDSLSEAFHYLEKMEQLAQILLHSKTEGLVLPQHEIQKILDICGKNHTNLDCTNCGNCLF